jgi:hypothetical protein
MRTFRTIILLASLAAWFAGPSKVSANGGLYGPTVGQATESGNMRAALHIDIVGGDSLTVDPGDVVTVVYRISDPEGRPATYLPKFDLPEGWSIVFGHQAVEITSTEPVTRFVTYKISGSELAGPFHPQLRLLDAEQQAVASAVTLIQVDSILDLAFEAGPSPTYVAAGTAFSVQFDLSNDGNTPVTVELDAQDRKFVKVELPQKRVRLLPGEFLSFEARITTDADLDHSQRASLRFDAQLEGNNPLSRFATVAFDVVPVYARMKPKAAKTPLSLAVETVGDENGVTPQASINAEGKVFGGQLTVQATLSEMPRQKFYGQERRFTANYMTEKVSVTVGDHQERFSPMTLTGERGMGVAASVRGEKWQVKGTAQQSRSIFPVQQRVGLSASYLASNTSVLSANLLHRNEYYSGFVFTIRSLSSPFGPSSKLDSECGISSQQSLQDPSCTLLFSNSTQRLSYRFQAQRASDNFPGTIAGVRTVSSYAAYRLNRSLRLDQTSSFSHRALGDGYGRSNLLFKAGVTYSVRLFGGSMYASAHGMRSESAYSMSLGDAERRENILRITTGYQLARIGFTASVEEGKAEDIAGSSAGRLSRWKSNARISPLRKWNLNATYELSSGNLSAMASEQRQTLYGLGSTVALPGDIRASVTAFRSVVETHIRQEYASVQGSLSKTFRSGRFLSARVQFNHNQGRQSLRTADYRVGFETPLAVPFTNRRGEEDILRGRVVDHVSGEPVADVLVLLGNDLAITDKQGRFRFGRPGQDVVFLRVDAASLGYDRAPVLPMPMQIGPEHYTGEEMVIPVARTASISGQMDVYGQKDAETVLVGNMDGELVRRSGFYGAVIQIESESLRYRTRTGRDGSFTFTQLPPNDYTISVLQANLDDHQRVETSELKVSLEQGETKFFAFRVVPARKTIRMIQSTNLSVGGSAIISERDASIQNQTARTLLDRPATERSDAYTPSDSTQPVDSAPDASQGATSAAPARVDRTPSSSWINMLKHTSRVRQERAGAGEREGSMVPWIMMRQGPNAPTPKPLHAPLLVLSLLFLILYVDLVFRQFVAGRPSVIVALRPPDWSITARFAWYYGTFILWATLWGGAMMGLAAALAFAGISATIEARHVYVAIWYVSRFTWMHRHGGDIWIRHRDSAIQVRSISLEALHGVRLDGSTVSLPTHRLNETTDALHRHEDRTTVSCSVTISRLADLRRVRQLLAVPIATAVMPSAPQAFRVSFHDEDAAWTRVDISLVAETASTSAEGLQELLRATLRAEGVTCREDRAYPHLRLVSIRKAA